MTCCLTGTSLYNWGGLRFVYLFVRLLIVTKYWYKVALGYSLFRYFLVANGCVYICFPVSASPLLHHQWVFLSPLQTCPRWVHMSVRALPLFHDLSFPTAKSDFQSSSLINLFIADVHKRMQACAHPHADTKASARPTQAGPTSEHLQTQSEAPRLRNGTWSTREGTSDSVLNFQTFL